MVHFPILCAQGIEHSTVKHCVIQLLSDSFFPYYILGIFPIMWIVPEHIFRTYMLYGIGLGVHRRDLPILGDCTSIIFLLSKVFTS